MSGSNTEHMFGIEIFFIREKYELFLAINSFEIIQIV